MSTTWRFPLILLLSVVFGAPVLSEMALASGDLPEAVVRYLAALGLAWLGVNAIARMMETYAAHNDTVRRAEAAEAVAEEFTAGRGSDDVAAASSETEGAPSPAMS